MASLLKKKFILKKRAPDELSKWRRRRRMCGQNAKLCSEKKALLVLPVSSEIPSNQHTCVLVIDLEEFVGKDGRLFREARVSLLHPLTDARGFMVVHWSTKRLENGMCARLVATPLFPPPRLLYPFNFDGAMLPLFPLICHTT